MLLLVHVTSRVEVKHQNKWGTVCGNGFTSADARVTCRAMGFRGGKTKYKFGREFYREAVGPMPIWIKNARCEVLADADPGTASSPLGGSEAAWPKRLRACVPRLSLSVSHVAVN